MLRVAALTWVLCCCRSNAASAAFHTETHGHPAPVNAPSQVVESVDKLGQDPINSFRLMYPTDGAVETIPVKFHTEIGIASIEEYKRHYGDAFLCVELDGESKMEACSSTVDPSVVFDALSIGNYTARAFITDREKEFRYHETSDTAFSIVSEETLAAHTAALIATKLPKELSLLEWATEKLTQSKERGVTGEGLRVDNRVNLSTTIVNTTDTLLIIGVKTALENNFAKEVDIQTYISDLSTSKYLEVTSVVSIHGKDDKDSIKVTYYPSFETLNSYTQRICAEMYALTGAIKSNSLMCRPVALELQTQLQQHVEAFEAAGSSDRAFLELWRYNLFAADPDASPLIIAYTYQAGFAFIVFECLFVDIYKHNKRPILVIPEKILRKHYGYKPDVFVFSILDADCDPVSKPICQQAIAAYIDEYLPFDDVNQRSRSTTIIMIAVTTVPRVPKQPKPKPESLNRRHLVRSTRLKRTMQVKYPIMGLSYARGFFAICGGGGSLKSGIKNTVDIYQLSDADPTGFSKEITADTGLELASNVAFSHDGQLVAVSVSAGCWVYALDVKQKTITLLVKFRTDFHEEDSSQTCARFVGNSTILTGGEDGVVRVWRLSRDPSKLEKDKGTAKALAVPEERDPHAKVVVDEQPKLGDCVISEANMVMLTREYRGHSKRIRDIDVDLSHRNLVVSSSEDQSCHLWRLTELTPICKFSKDDALDIAFQRLPTKPTVGPRKHLFRCVRFANSGRRLYTVLTPARGDSILIKWKPETIAQENEEQWSWVVEKAAIAGDKPVASLCVSQDDRFVCVAAVTGEIKVFLASTLQQYKIKSTVQHTFAITGMSFAPSADKQAPIFHLVSGGADKNLLRHEIPLEGGIVKSGMEIVVGGLESMVAATVGLGLNLWMASTLLFILLLFIHAETAMLLDGPLVGFNDLASLSFDSSDGLVTIGALVASAVVTWLFAASSSVTSRFFWNGLLCLLSGLVAFLVAISAELEVNWQTGDAAVDELLDYKIAIALGACCIAFFFCHSLLVLTL
ncbi:hypothetical protein PHYPSEUDO_007038 [Phytophthora pseudosyringae]|uniref:Uncharacterized protein n=1 Tax=Phytophthora pseudosyringae TaxID=221518 RepID=A0A8T1VK59_9STRA|nr:hypothetical protein PHYPSEUDO_007038 [Phytophthora pseudosyringae]